MTMKKNAIQFPIVAGQLDERVDIQAPKSLGITVNVYVHEVARKLDSYNQSIKFSAKGQDSSGKKIAVDTVGRWLFGVPGYESHIRIVSTGDKISLYYPKESPDVVHELVSHIKKAIEE
jgi:hypothetical protein